MLRSRMSAQPLLGLVAAAMALAACAGARNELLAPVALLDGGALSGPDAAASSDGDGGPPCTPGVACAVPDRPCAVGATTCAGGTAGCTETGPARANGTA